MEAGRRYDIVRRKDEKAVIWLEGAEDLGRAESRVKQLTSFWPGEYEVFDLQTKQVVLSTHTPASNPADRAETTNAG
jgi:hypothetical protein